VFLDEPADVTLKVYDLQGALVHESSTRIGSAGNQILSWDGKRSGGGRVAPGGYVGVISKRYGGRTDTQKFKLAVLY
jgi:flagellar hook assembly protein FlgD